MQNRTLGPYFKAINAAADDGRTTTGEGQTLPAEAAALGPIQHAE
jgi:hypothetical protein